MPHVDDSDWYSFHVGIDQGATFSIHSTVRVPAVIIGPYGEPRDLPFSEPGTYYLVISSADIPARYDFTLTILDLPQDDAGSGHDASSMFENATPLPDGDSTGTMGAFEGTDVYSIAASEGEVFNLTVKGECISSAVFGATLTDFISGSPLVVSPITGTIHLRVVRTNGACAYGMRLERTPRIEWASPLRELPINASALGVREFNAVAGMGETGFVGTNVGVAQFTLNGSFQSMWNTGARAYALTIDASGELFATEAASIDRLGGDRQIERLARGYGGLARGSDGSLYSSDATESNLGRTMPNGTTVIVVPNVNPTALAFGPDGLLYAEARVFVPPAQIKSELLQINVENRTSRVLFVGDGFDPAGGIALDTLGRVYFSISSFGETATVRRYDPATDTFHIATFGACRNLAIVGTSLVESCYQHVYAAEIGVHAYVAPQPAFSPTPKPDLQVSLSNPRLNGSNVLVEARVTNGGNSASPPTVLTASSSSLFAGSITDHIPALAAGESRVVELSFVPPVVNMAKLVPTTYTVVVDATDAALESHEENNIAQTVEAWPL